MYMIRGKSSKAILPLGFLIIRWNGEIATIVHKLFFPSLIHCTSVKVFIA